MPAPKSMDAYQDVEAHLERALNSPRGIAITVSEPGRAIQLVQKFNTYKERLRRNSKKIYPEDDPRFGTSPYDKLQAVRDPDNELRVLVRPMTIAVVKVEDL